MSASPNGTGPPTNPVCTRPIYTTVWLVPNHCMISLCYILGNFGRKTPETCAEGLLRHLGKGKNRDWDGQWASGCTQQSCPQFLLSLSISEVGGLISGWFGGLKLWPCLKLGFLVRLKQNFKQLTGSLPSWFRVLGSILDLGTVPGADTKCVQDVLETLEVAMVRIRSWFGKGWVCGWKI